MDHYIFVYSFVLRVIFEFSIRLDSRIEHVLCDATDDILMFLYFFLFFYFTMEPILFKMIVFFFISKKNYKLNSFESQKVMKTSNDTKLTRRSSSPEKNKVLDEKMRKSPYRL